MHPQPFPDYDHFKEEASNYDGPKLSLQSLSQKIASINALQRTKGKPILDNIVAIILHHSILTNKPVSPQRPSLGGSVCSGGNGIIFNLNNFDPDLQLIIYLYIKDITKN